MLVRLKRIKNALEIKRSLYCEYDVLFVQCA